MVLLCEGEEEGEEVEFIEQSWKKKGTQLGSVSS